MRQPHLGYTQINKYTKVIKVIGIHRTKCNNFFVLNHAVPSITKHFTYIRTRFFTMIFFRPFSLGVLNSDAWSICGTCIQSVDSVDCEQRSE